MSRHPKSRSLTRAQAAVSGQPELPSELVFERYARLEVTVDGPQRALWMWGEVWDSTGWLEPVPGHRVQLSGADEFVVTLLRSLEPLVEG